MRVLISTDIEGVAGVFHPEQTRPGNPEYERARVLMTREANAAIEGAFDAGAAEVLVNDSHGGYRNMPAELLDARARAVQGKPRALGMMAGLETGVDAVCLVGWHARAQGRGVLAHTINSFAFARVWFGGRELGEAGIYGALAGEHGVPVVMASGDDVFVEELRPLFPGAVLVQTKVAYGQAAGVSLSPAQSCAVIRGGVREALARRAAIAPLVMPGPIEVRIEATRPDLADLFCQWPTLERLGGVAVGFEAPTVEAAVRMINCLSAMSAALR